MNSSIERRTLKARVRPLRSVNFFNNLMRKLFAGCEIEVRRTTDGKLYGYVTTQEIRERTAKSSSTLPVAKLIERYGDKKFGFNVQADELE